VVGVKGVYGDPNSDMMTGAGITCAICHVNVTPTAFKCRDRRVFEVSVDALANLDSDGFVS
jgi:hypothetical protein